MKNVAERNTFAIDKLGRRLTSELLDHVLHYTDMVEALGKHSDPVMQRVQEEISEALEAIQDELQQRTGERAKQVSATASFA